MAGSRLVILAVAAITATIAIAAAASAPASAAAAAAAAAAAQQRRRHARRGLCHPVAPVICRGDAIRIVAATLDALVITEAACRHGLLAPLKRADASPQLLVLEQLRVQK